MPLIPLPVKEAVGMGIGATPGASTVSINSTSGEGSGWWFKNAEYTLINSFH